MGWVGGKSGLKLHWPMGSLACTAFGDPCSNLSFPIYSLMSDVNISVAFSFAAFYSPISDVNISVGRSFACTL